LLVSVLGANVVRGQDWD